ncbi:Hsp70 family protein [Corynebacterium aquatimens]|uniref:Actin-like ATPase involved in cell morphogenesis n=1 Tax=Corynebacterium aquatimens TaxID=1190508 RepID=A0A931E2H2_9CORY|nr:Hsp70 family protein [Corynebacterium aquatimens]MBG6123038.1 actin-like ATPase involved in cell morphogenesis [Corynebacterium aquatimens]WJY66628.1 Chaperone protein HscA [Corynebacterium aquatimens]
MTQSFWILAIDFGTSNTAAAHTNPLHGHVEAINLSADYRTMPSSVYVTSPDNIATGNRALELAEEDPSGFIPSPKRLVPRHTIHIKNHDIPASHAVAAVLHSVIATAAKLHDNTAPSRVILTHPEAWSDREIAVLTDAARIAGVAQGTVTTLSEPKAAAHYYSQNNHLTPGDTLAIFDIGGGTLDVAVLTAQPDGSFTVTAADGDNSIGGKTFDAMLRRWVEEQLESDNPDLAEYFSSTATHSEHQELDYSIRRAKEALSDSSTATITARAGGMSERLLITREEFEGLIAPAVDRAVALTAETLRRAKITSPHQITHLYLTGGSSRVPILQERLKDLGRVGTLDDPKTVVSQGAVVHAKRAPSTHTPATQSHPVQPEQVRSQQAHSQQVHSQHVQPQSKQVTREQRSSISTSAKKNRTSIIAAGSIVALVVVGGLAWGIMSGGSTTTSSTSTTASPTAVNTVDAAEQWDRLDPQKQATVTDEEVQRVKDSVPGAALEGLESCAFDTVEDRPDVFGAWCHFDPNGRDRSLVKSGLKPEDDIQFLFELDYDIDGSHQGYESANPQVAALSELRVSKDGTRKAFAVEDENGTFLNYQDSTNGMTIGSNSFKDIDSALAWAENIGLLD